MRTITLAIISGVIIVLIILVAVAAHFRSPAYRIAEMKEHIPALREFALEHNDSLDIMLNIQQRLDSVIYAVGSGRDGININVYDTSENRYSITRVEQKSIEESTHLDEVEKSAIAKVFLALEGPYKSITIDSEGVEVFINETPRGTAIASLCLTNNPRLDLHESASRHIELLHSIWYAEISFFHRG